MVATGLIEQAHTTLDSAPFWIRGTKIDAAQAAMGNGTGAHGARLERDVKVAAIEPARAASGKCRPYGQEFCMGCRVGQGLHPVALSSKDAVALDDDGAHRSLAGGGGFFGETQGKVHGRWAGHAHP